MAPLESILILVLLFEAGVSGELTLYKIPGQDAILPCGSVSSSDTTCSIIAWLFYRDPSKSFTEVQNGNVDKSSARAARLSLDTNCALVINNVTAEDAGRYTCRQGRNASQDVNTLLSVLTISPSAPDADPKRDGEVTLKCSLMRYGDLGPCGQNSIRWVDETGTVLLGEGVGQMNCTSVLTVKRQSGHNRRFTCQVVDEKNNAKIKAGYTPVFTDSTERSYLALRIAGLSLMIVITVLVITLRGNTKPLDNKNNVNNEADEVEYENVEAHLH